MKHLLDAGLLHGDCLTVTGKTMAENLAEHRPAGARRRGRAPARATPIHAEGGIASSRGSLAPKGVGREGRRHRRSIASRARPASSTARTPRWRRSSPGTIKPGDVVVIRYEGPKGGPGMREMLADHRRDEGRRARRRLRAHHRRPLLAAARTGFCIGHVAPEAVDGGPIAFVRDGDRIVIDVDAPHASTCSSTTPSWPARKADWKLPEPRYTTGVLAKYARSRRAPNAAPSPRPDLTRRSRSGRGTEFAARHTVDRAGRLELAVGRCAVCDPATSSSTRHRLHLSGLKCPGPTAVVTSQVTLSARPTASCAMLDDNDLTATGVAWGWLTTKRPVRHVPTTK